MTLRNNFQNNFESKDRILRFTAHSFQVGAMAFVMNTHLNMATENAGYGFKLSASTFAPNLKQRFNILGK